MEKEELLIKRHEEDIRKWDLEIAELEKKIELAGGQKKKDLEKEMKKISHRIARTKKETEKLKRKIEDYAGPKKDKMGELKPPIYPPRSTG